MARRPLEALNLERASYLATILSAAPIILLGLQSVGRIGLYELLTVTPELRRLLRPEVDTADIRRAACEQGMRPLRVSAAFQLAKGVTTFAEVMQVLPPLEED